VKFQWTSSNHLSLASRESIFVESVECFALMIENKLTRAKVTQALGLLWQLPIPRIQFFQSLYQPALQLTETAFSIGRVTVPKLNSITVGVND
jgi:hypothetical protein